MQHVKEDVVFVLRQLIRVANTSQQSFNEANARIFLGAARTILLKSVEEGDRKIKGSEEFYYIDAVVSSKSTLHHRDARHAARAATTLLRAVLADMIPKSSDIVPLGSSLQKVQQSEDGVNRMGAGRLQRIASFLKRKNSKDTDPKQ